MRKSAFFVFTLGIAAAIFATTASISAAGSEDPARPAHTSLFVSAFNAPDLSPACAEGPVNTGINLSAGEQVVITATGVAAWDQFSGTNGPDGSTAGLGHFVTDGPIGALIGRIGPGEWMHIGRGPTTVAGPGRLQLAFDDAILLCNNSGGFTVDVHTSRPTTTDDCKGDDWRSFGVFKNQGDCVSHVTPGGKH